MQASMSPSTSSSAEMVPFCSSLYRHWIGKYSWGKLEWCNRSAMLGWTGQSCSATDETQLHTGAFWLQQSHHQTPTLSWGKGSCYNWQVAWLCWVSSFVFAQANQIAGIRACILATLAIPVHTSHMDYVHVIPSERYSVHNQVKCYQTLLPIWGFGSGNKTKCTMSCDITCTTFLNDIIMALILTLSLCLVSGFPGSGITSITSSISIWRNPHKRRPLTNQRLGLTIWDLLFLCTELPPHKQRLFLWRCTLSAH